MFAPPRETQVSMFDVLAWTYLYTKIWMISGEAPCSYWLWLMSYRMSAVSAAGMGVLISVVVPEHSATLATSVAVIATGPELAAKGLPSGDFPTRMAGYGWLVV